MLPVKVSCGRRDSSGTRRGAYHHAVPIDDAEVVQGLRVTPLPRTLCDCIASASFADALAYADGAIRVTSLSVERLGDAVRALNPRPHHAERVLDVLTHADGRSANSSPTTSPAAPPKWDVEHLSSVLALEPARTVGFALLEGCGQDDFLKAEGIGRGARLFLTTCTRRAPHRRAEASGRPRRPRRIRHSQLQRARYMVGHSLQGPRAAV